MSRTCEANVLLGALLNRLDNTQAKALLVRQDQWLTRDARDASPQDNKQLTGVNSALRKFPTFDEKPNGTEFPT